MPNYRRLLVPGGTYFFTVNLRNRRHAILIDCIAGLRTNQHAARGLETNAFRRGMMAGIANAQPALVY